MKYVRDTIIYKKYHENITIDKYIRKRMPRLNNIDPCIESLPPVPLSISLNPPFMVDSLCTSSNYPPSTLYSLLIPFSHSLSYFPPSYGSKQPILSLPSSLTLYSIKPKLTIHPLSLPKGTTSSTTA